MPETLPDHETLYRLLYDEQWPALLDALHHRHAEVAADPLLARAVETFVATFFETLAASRAENFETELEKLFLLHTGGFYPLDARQFERVVACLVTINAARPAAAVGYARFCPENARCAAILASHAPPEAVAHGEDAAVEMAVRTPLVPEDHTRALFRSRQEIDFFLAAREVFPTYFVYPNVALSCVVDYEAIKAELSGEERRYFFHALLDCVVFDQHDGYRPRYFFELDSPHHDTDARRANDRRKERILALAGQRLHRLRPRTRTAHRNTFVALLKELVEGEN